MNELNKIVDAAKNVGNIALDVAELAILAHKADDDQRKAAVSYMEAHQEQRGQVKGMYQWNQFYTGVKKRLTV